jgi:hypothetical protein
MIAKRLSAWGLRPPVIALLFAMALGHSPVVWADTWTGGFTGRSGIVWAYRVQVDGKLVKLTIRGDSGGKKFEATCADSALDVSNTFEASCLYLGSNLPFKVRAELKGNSTYAAYVAANGDRTTVQLMSDGKAPTNSSPPRDTSGSQDNHLPLPAPRPSEPTPSPQNSANATPLRLPACDRMNFLMNFTRHSFVNGDDPILGVPPSKWTIETLSLVEQWATKCLSESPRSAGNGNTWEMFRRDALIGMDMRRELNQKAEAAQKAKEVLGERWNRATVLSAGGSVSCRALGTAEEYRASLDGPLFGQSLRLYTPDDFQAVRNTLSECDRVSWISTSMRYPYYPNRRGLDVLPQQREALLRAEIATKEQDRLAREKIREEERAAAALVEKARGVAAELEQNPRAFGGTWPDAPMGDSVKLAEPPQCHDPRVLAFFFDSLYRKHIAAALKQFQEQPTAATAQSVLALSAWKISVENIRQTDFDPKNHVRQCSATFQSNDDKLDWGLKLEGMLSLAGLRCGSLTPQLSYRLELLLDKPINFYVSYVCR